jgi:hypothetical protein
MEDETQRSNMATLFGVKKIPTNDQIRNVIDKIEFSTFNKAFYSGLNLVKDNNYLDK